MLNNMYLSSGNHETSTFMPISFSDWTIWWIIFVLIFLFIIFHSCLKFSKPNILGRLTLIMEEPQPRKSSEHIKKKRRILSYQTPYFLESDDSDDMMMPDSVEVQDVQIRQDRLLVHIMPKFNRHNYLFYCRKKSTC